MVTKHEEMVMDYFRSRNLRPGEFTVEQDIMRYFEDNELTGGDALETIETLIEVGRMVRHEKNRSQVALRQRSLQKTTSA